MTAALPCVALCKRIIISIGAAAPSAVTSGLRRTNTQLRCMRGDGVSVTPSLSLSLCAWSSGGASSLLLEAQESLWSHQGPADMTDWHSHFLSHFLTPEFNGFEREPPHLGFPAVVYDMELGSDFHATRRVFGQSHFSPNNSTWHREGDEQHWGSHEQLHRCVQQHSSFIII